MIQPTDLMYVGGASLTLSILLVALVRSNARPLGLVDPVTPRSSHDVPVPRGGGVGFIVPLILAVAIAPADSPARTILSTLAITIVAVLGWWDDRASLPIAPRLVGQLASGIAVAAMAVGLSGEYGSVPSGLVFLWWVFWTMSCVNVVNFLDGIDGLVAGQGLVFAAFAVVAAPEPSVTVPAVALSGGLLGFLAFNRPPARVFMGDVGSAALGVGFVVIGLEASRVRGWTVIHAFLPLAPMFVDEVLTMARRLSGGERLWRPHRTHVYQIAARVAGHGPVSAAYAALSMGGAMVALSWPHSTAAFAVAATTYIILTALILWVVRGASHGAIDRARSTDRDASS